MRKNSQSFNKWKVYVLTFCYYMALHSMRMTYSHIVPSFKEAFHQSNLYIGIFDASIYIALSLGFFLRFLLKDKQHLLRSFFVYTTLACLGYLLIPVISISLEQNVTNNSIFQKILPGVGLLIFGFCQFAVWPTFMSLINRHFSIKSEGTALGIWSANGDVGNIIGFSLSGLIVDNLSCRWEVAMIVVAIFCWVLGLVVYLFIDEIPFEQDNALIQEQINEAQSINQHIEKKTPHQQFMIFIRKSFVSIEIILYLLAMALLKSILYGFLLWMPTYLTHNHMASQKSIVPIIFNVGTLIGSWILGSFYQDTDQVSSTTLNTLKKHFKLYSLFYACLGMVASLVFFYLVKNNLIVYFLCSLISGAFLGGCFNMLAGNEVFSMTRGSQQSLSFLSTLSMICGNFCVGIVEIVIGVVLDMKNDPQGEHKLFVILIAVGCLGMLVMFWRSRLQQEKHYAEVEQTESKTMKQ